MGKLIDSETAYETIHHLLYETAMNNTGVKSDDISEIYSEIADNRLKIWLDLIPEVNAIAEIEDINNIECWKNENAATRAYFEHIGDILRISANVYGETSKENVMHFIGKAFDDCSERKTGKETTK